MFPVIGLKNSGDITEKIDFTIKLTRCGSDVSNANIKFDGASVSEDTTLYKLEEGSVEGLALAIYDNNKQSISNGIKKYQLCPYAIGR
nr:hypothetical protein [Escherichia sp. E2593]